jgi:uncharacterized protein (TIGR02217 family)
LGVYVHQRTITKPLAGSVTVTLDDILTEAFTVSATIGQVTMASAPAMGVIVRASFLFHVPVRFDTDSLDIVCVEPGIWSWPSIRLVETKNIL